MAGPAKADCSHRTSARTSARDSRLACRKQPIRETTNHHCGAHVKGPCKPKINQMSSFQWRTWPVPQALHYDVGLSPFWWDRGIYRQVTWLVLSNLVLSQYKKSRKKSCHSLTELHFTVLPTSIWKVEVIHQSHVCQKHWTSTGIEKFTVFCYYVSLIKVQVLHVRAGIRTAQVAIYIAFYLLVTSIFQCSHNMGTMHHHLLDSSFPLLIEQMS